MKIRNLILGLLACVGSGVAVADELISVELLPNPEMNEDVNADGWPDGWPTVSGGESLVDDGRPYIRIEQGEAGAFNMLYREVRVPSRYRALRFEIDSRVIDIVRGADLWNEARIIFQFKDLNNKKLSPKPRPVILGKKGTSDWRKRSVEFLVPEGAITLEIMTGHFMSKSGIVDIRSMSLQPVAEEALLVRRAEYLLKNPKPIEIPFEAPIPAQFPPEVFVVGNRLKTAAGDEVWLQGANVPSMEWVATGERIMQSTAHLIEQWNVNCIRLPVHEDYWLGTADGSKDGGQAYRHLVDSVVNYCSNRGVYVVIDLHRFRAPRVEHVTFWESAAARYANHPAVLFDLLNEPHSISWELWRNGGDILQRKTPADEDNFLSEEARKKARSSFYSPGMQALVAAVRSTGARNVVIAGGLDWAYDLSGIVNGYALEESEAADGNGIMYSTHIYPWKSGWQSKVLDAAALHPIFIGEVGADEIIMSWMPEEVQGDPATWVPDMLGLIQRERLNWTAWCFHPSASPRMLEDWTYKPTPFWGAPAKAALLGESFELKRLR
ncbi:MAG: glycoside hydrolase family 5 [Puniceicoccaceae bacterium]|nr:glycoside hydrolase family 5 [Puniceicoccaceae bacterium]|tara:strand:- start:4794 stop:6449 length:1656 start_codon:yes stop_codon:yes gene_type:complete